MLRSSTDPLILLTWIEPDFRDDFLRRQIRHLVHQDPLADESVSVISQWLNVCQNHRECQPKDNSLPSLPTRVLDVGLTSLDNLYLFETQGHKAKYIALSHSWGKSQTFTTTRETIQNFRTYIIANEMPKTFRDTVCLARLLRIRYVWIDSLCIIQDDPDDWEQESAKMAEVYRESYLTIAASVAASDAKGFLHERKPAFAPYGSFEIDGQRHSIYLCPRITTHAERDAVQDLLQQEPLTHRAWTVQERLLSRKILYFGSH